MVVRKSAWILAGLVMAAGAVPVAAQRPHPFMGIMINPNPDGPGVLINDVAANGPADLAWLRPGDVIEGLILGEKDDHPVRTVPDLQNLMSQVSVGDTVTVRYQRGHKKRLTQVTVRTEPRTNRPRAN
jgi:S1-C subfamily serine protease